MDDDFVRWSQERLHQASNRGSGGASVPYEPPFVTGLVADQPKIVRVLGEAPDSGKTPLTARTVRIATVLDRDGKKRKLVYPANPQGHLLWRIVQKVREVEWLPPAKPGGKRTKRPKYENTRAYQLVMKNGLDPSSAQYTFDRGWEGREVLVMNVIDRSMMDRHRELKRYALLCRSVNPWVSPDGREFLFYEEGVPTYSFLEPLIQDVIVPYGHFGRYDLCLLKRANNKTAPYSVFNASAEKVKVPAQYRHLVVEGPLTEEELSWQGYNLEKMYAPTKYSKIKEWLGDAVHQVDKELGTSFFAELHRLVEAEKAQPSPQTPPGILWPVKGDLPEVEGLASALATGAGEEEEVPFNTPAPAQAALAHQVRGSAVRGVVPAGQQKGSDILQKTAALGWRQGALARGPHTLRPEFLEMVRDVRQRPDGDWELIVDFPDTVPHAVRDLVPCECGLYSPQLFDVCLRCGIKF